MVKYTKIPAISGKKLINLLKKDGWVVTRRTRHGVALTKTIGDRTLVTIIPDTNTKVLNNVTLPTLFSIQIGGNYSLKSLCVRIRASLDDGTLAAILSPKQTNLRKDGLLALLNKYGL